MFRNRTSAVPALVLTVLLAGCQKDAGANPPAAAPAAAVEPKTDDEKTLYALGIVMGRNLTSLGLAAAELDMLKVGMTDEALGKEKKVKLEEFGPKIQAFAQGKAAAMASKEKQASEAYLAKAATEKGAVKKPSGLIYSEVAAGSGPSPSLTDAVKVHYTGKLIDGTVFDSSVARGEPAEFPVTGVIGGWIEALTLMPVGSKWELTIPHNLAYGERGAGASIPPFSTLVFEVELLDII